MIASFREAEYMFKPSISTSLALILALKEAEYAVEPPVNKSLASDADPDNAAKEADIVWSVVVREALNAVWDMLNDALTTSKSFSFYHPLKLKLV